MGALRVKACMVPFASRASKGPDAVKATVAIDLHYALGICSAFILRFPIDAHWQVILCP